MSLPLTRKGVIISIGLILFGLIVVLLVGLTTKPDKYAVSEVKNTPSGEVILNLTDNQDILTEAQKALVKENMLTMTSKEIQDNTQITAKIRPSSLEILNENEINFIVDSDQLQTSYSVNRFTDNENDLDIVNVFCVNSSQQKYSKDYCRAE